MIVSLSLLQRIKLEIMLADYRCETLKDMADMTALFNAIRPTDEAKKDAIFQAGTSLMIKEDAAKATTDVELTEAQAGRLKQFVTDWKGGWSVSDNVWVTDLLSKL